MIAFVNRVAVVGLVVLLLAACGAGSVAPASAPSAAASQSEPAVPSTSPSQAASDTAAPTESSAPSPAAPSDTAAPTESSAPTVCLPADILAAVESYRNGKVPADPSMDEVADALAALELDGQAAEYRDGVVAALRGETGETEDEWKLHDALFSLLPLESEIKLVEC